MKEVENQFGKGFHITFENGITVSIQFGYGNYCEARNLREDYVIKAFKKALQKTEKA